MEAERLEIQGRLFLHSESTASLGHMRPCLKKEKENPDSLDFGTLGKVVAVAILFESEGLLTIPCQAPGLLETSLSSSALCSLPGADITQAACGEHWLRGQRPKCAQCGVWHHPAASARTPCLCQGQMQRLRLYRQPQPGPRVQNCTFQRREPVMMPRPTEGATASHGK